MNAMARVIRSFEFRRSSFGFFHFGDGDGETDGERAQKLVSSEQDRIEKLLEKDTGRK